MEFNQEETRFLQSLGRQEVGRDLVNILKRAKNHYSSINTIDTTRDATAQIEGRKIFSEFIDELTTTIETRKREVKAKETDDFT